ncbi:MAG: hypothetical protein IPK26_04990 [Planctomycetes bacterium]|nr:hypothetical protein [Planctomycetota bacterium]
MQGDVLRVGFCGASVCCPTYYLHQLDVRDAGGMIGSVVGCGVLTVALPNTGPVRIDVHARNNRDTGWYAFKFDRLNDPVGASQIAFDWTIPGSMSGGADFDVFTLHASAGAAGLLRFTGASVCCPTYFLHYAEVLDATGQRIAAVLGDGVTPFTFPATGLYTVLVSARNYQDSGWYSVKVDCNSRPWAACDCNAHASSYGRYCAGTAGTNGIPTLAASLPRLGQNVNVAIGNSYGQATSVMVLLGATATNSPLPAFNARLCVGNPTVLAVMPLAAGGTTLSYAIPNDSLLCGIGLAVQTAVVDPGATGGGAFSDGLLLVLGL